MHRITTVLRSSKSASAGPVPFRLNKVSFSISQLRNSEDKSPPSTYGESASEPSNSKQPNHKSEALKQQHKTQAQLDEELRQKLAGLAGDGGEAGVEYEDGQPVAMKRSVQKNMFRYI